MFSKTDKVYASGKHSVIRDMYVDPDELVFYAGTKSLYIFKKEFSQLAYKDFLQNGRETGKNNRNPT